jgi:peptidoglycan biosynthesis protein MviN/MurJ (putative lipid II flippase)
MVLPVSEDTTHQGREWARWIIGLAVASLVFGGVGWLATGSLSGTLYAVGIPWMMAVFFFVVSLIWGVTMVPLMMLVARLTGREPVRRAGRE